jgi:hypothetical protein
MSHFRLSLLFLFLVAVSSLSGAAHAAEVPELYETAVPVEGQEAEQRSAAMMEALSQVLIKVTGHRDIVARGELEEKLKAAASYVRHYRFEQAAEEGQQLKVQFDEHAVNRLLHEQGLPVWNGNRPLVLCWLGLEVKGNHRIAAPELDTKLFSQLEAAMKNRGLRSTFPLMDLTDRAALSANLLWEGSAATIRKASERYGADLILVGRLALDDDNQWRAGWTLYPATGARTWKGTGANRAEALQSGVQVLADQLAQRYAPIRERGNRSRVRIHVAGIQQLEDYERVNSHLLQLDSVEQADLFHAEPDAVVYELMTNSGKEVLQQEIALGSLLQSEPGPVGQETETTDGADQTDPATSATGEEIVLYYRLQP